MNTNPYFSVEEIEICVPIHIRLMWLRERNLKSLKEFVRITSRAKGLMFKGYILYQYIVVYFSGYIR